MDRILTLFLAGGFGLAFLVALVRMLTAARRRQAARAAFFDDCKALLTDIQIGTGTAGFPRIGGNFQGVPVDLQAVPDTLTFRKLPALWVLVTLPAPLPLRATLDLMIRPNGLEPFSHFGQLPEQLVLPPGFPEAAAIRTDDAKGLLAAELLYAHLGLFDDPRMKELVLSPKGLRAVFLAEEADRTRYLLFRDAEMGSTPLPAVRLETVLRSLLAIRRDVLAVANGKDAA